MSWDEEIIPPPNNNALSSTIFLQIGTYDKFGSELMYQHFKYAPDFVQSFLKWFETDNARIIMLEGSLKIEIKPNMGTLHVSGYPSAEIFGAFLQVMLNPSKTKLPLLQIQGGVGSFNTFVHAASMDDDNWDINFMTTFKYLVGKYNDYAKKRKWPIFEMRHSLLETTKSQDQSIYNNDPTYFITRVVSLFDRLETNIDLPQYAQQIDNSIIKAYYPNLQRLFVTYHQYIDILQDAINMLVPPEVRGEKRYKEDVKALAPFLFSMFPDYITDTDQYLQLLYQSILAKKTFPWIDQQHENIFFMLDLSYDIMHLQEIDNGQFGKDLQLIATAIYFLFFTVGKLYPHLNLMEEEIVTLFSDVLREMLNNFNPLNLGSRQQDQGELFGFLKLHSLFVFLTGLREGYDNPYNDYFPEDAPDFMGDRSLDSILKDLPDAPRHDINDSTAFKKLPSAPTYIINKEPDAPTDIITDDNDVIDKETNLYPDVSADKERYKDTPLYPDLQSPRHQAALINIDQAYVDYIKNIEPFVPDVSLSEYEEEEEEEVKNIEPFVPNVSLSEYEEEEEEEEENNQTPPLDYFSDVSTPAPSSIPSISSDYEDIGDYSEYGDIGNYNQGIVPQPPQTPI